MSLTSLIKSLTVEPFVFFMLFSYMISVIPMEQLQQDKVCILKLNQSVKYCLAVAKSSTSEIKLSIISQSNQFSLYDSILQTVPNILWCLLVGSLCDKYKSMAKTFMVMGCFSQVVRNLALLINVIFFYELSTGWLLVSSAIGSLTGSLWAGATVALAYASKTTSGQFRAIKFLAIQGTFSTSIAVGNLVSGEILGLDSWIHGHEIRNFSGPFIIGAVSAACGCLWVFFMIESEGTQELKAVDDNDNEQLIKAKNFTLRDVLSDMNPITILRSFKSALFKHESGVRSQILILVGIQIILLLEQSGMTKILFGFAQRVYLWDYETFTGVSTYGLFIGPIACALILYWIQRSTKLSDLEVSIIGMISSILSTLCVGSIINPYGFYLKLAVGFFGGVVTASLRSRLTKIIHQDETTTIFAAMTVMEVLGPVISTAIYTPIFNATISVYPSLVFQITTLTLFIPLIMVMYIEFKFDRTFSKELISETDSVSQP